MRDEKKEPAIGVPAGVVGDELDGMVRRHRARLAQVAEATASAVIITDVQGVTVWVNAGFTRITGYTFAEAVGMTPGQLLQGPDTDRAEAARIGAALRDRRSVAAELINYSKDGRRYWIGMKIEPLASEGGEIDGFMAIEADITERQERNRALEELTRRFNMATQAGGIGVYERTAGFGDIWWSEAMYAIAGQDPATFRPSVETWLELVHPDDRQYVSANAGSPKKARTVPSLQYRIVRPDGTVRHIQSITSSAVTLDGAPDRISGVLLDVTERVESEERELVLQQRLRESSHQAGMAEIATGILHNVGNVLNSLGIANSTARRDLKALRLDKLTQASSILKTNRANLAAFLTDDARGRHLPDYLSALSAQIAANVQAIQSELDTTDQLILHLRDIVSAQQELARFGGLREPVDLPALADSALLLHASELAQIEIIREYDELPPITTDRHKLLQILVNLISNARDAVYAASTHRGRIVVRLRRDGSGALISIEDSGIGMSAEVLSRLWRFGFTTKQSGHGFGLHNSANAAHEIGATLTAHSDGAGTGSRFTLRLPFGADEPMLSGVAA